MSEWNFSHNEYEELSSNIVRKWGLLGQDVCFANMYNYNCAHKQPNMQCIAHWSLLVERSLQPCMEIKHYRATWEHCLDAPSPRELGANLIVTETKQQSRKDRKKA